MGMTLFPSTVTGKNAGPKFKSYFFEGGDRKEENPGVP